MSRVRTEQIHKLSKDLHHLQTNPTLQTHMMHIVERWTASKPIDVPTLSFTFPATQLRKAHNEQIQIGIQFFFKGIISKKIGTITGRRLSTPSHASQIQSHPVGKTINHIVTGYSNNSVE